MNELPKFMEDTHCITIHKSVSSSPTVCLNQGIEFREMIAKCMRYFQTPSQEYWTIHRRALQAALGRAQPEEIREENKKRQKYNREMADFFELHQQASPFNYFIPIKHFAVITMDSV